MPQQSTSCKPPTTGCRRNVNWGICGWQRHLYMYNRSQNPCSPSGRYTCIVYSMTASHTFILCSIMNRDCVIVKLKSDFIPFYFLKIRQGGLPTAWVILPGTTARRLSLSFTVIDPFACLVAASLCDQRIADNRGGGWWCPRQFHLQSTDKGLTAHTVTVSLLTRLLFQTKSKNLRSSTVDG